MAAQRFHPGRQSRARPVIVRQPLARQHPADRVDSLLQHALFAVEGRGIDGRQRRLEPDPQAPALPGLWPDGITGLPRRSLLLVQAAPRCGAPGQQHLPQHPAAGLAVLHAHDHPVVEVLASRQACHRPGQGQRLAGQRSRQPCLQDCMHRDGQHRQQQQAQAQRPRTARQVQQAPGQQPAGQAVQGWQPSRELQQAGTGQQAGGQRHQSGQHQPPGQRAAAPVAEGPDRRAGMKGWNRHRPPSLRPAGEFRDGGRAGRPRPEAQSMPRTVSRASSR